MSTIIIETRIRAPIELCFDLARDVNAHAESAAFSSERIVEPGRTQGLLEIGDIVAFEAATLVAPSDSSPGSPRWIGCTGSSMKWFRARSNGSGTCTNSNSRTEQPSCETRSSGKLHWEFSTVWPILLFLRRHMRWFVATKQNDLKRIAEERANSVAK